MNHRLLLLTLILFTSSFSIAQPSTHRGGDAEGREGLLDSLRNEVKASFLSQPSDTSAKSWIRTLRPDGSWPDIDYTDQSRSLWQLEKHLDRIITLAIYANVPDGLPSGKKALDAAIKALRCWFKGNYVNPNWWYQKIGIPRRLLTIAYLLDENIPDELRPQMVQALSTIDSDDYPARPGGDRIQVISNHAKVLLWQRDEMRTAQLFAKIESEAQFAPMEETMYDAAGGLEVRNEHRPAGRGFQSDMTFHHRGDRVDCTLTYGMEVPEFYTQWALLLQNTPWRFSDEHTRFVIDYYLDAVRWHLVGDEHVEPAAYNRELARPGKTEFSADEVLQRLLILCNGYREDELKAFATHANNLSGSRYFWQSDYFAFKSKSYQTAVRMHSHRNANQEYPHNSEGIKNHFRGDGACHFSVDGSEYSQIWPVFDFSMVPGTTSPLLTEMPPMNEVQMRRSPIVFSGAITDQHLGACGMDFKSYRNDLQARKSWFFFDEGYVCLGTGITSTLPDTIITTIEQSRLPRRARYTLITETPLLQSEGMRHGAWRNVVRDAEHADNEATMSVFSLAINHGVKPQNASYAYAVAPLSTPEDRAWYKVIAQTDTVHAVASTDETIAFCVFFEPGSIGIMGHSITVGEPCMLMLHDGKRYISDPTRQQYKLRVNIDGESKEVRIPTWQYAGTTVEF